MKIFMTSSFPNRLLVQLYLGKQTLMNSVWGALLKLLHTELLETLGNIAESQEVHLEDLPQLLPSTSVLQLWVAILEVCHPLALSV
jgi:hypothetical protein|tara:strand:- start:2839 stop:3096 length:258 start_codon:yes stop_codon:yes gene_type:complete